jgi:hypothetical protein
MSTEKISDKIDNISKSIQNGFSELIKIVLKKSIKSSPDSNKNTFYLDKIYNKFTGKYEEPIDSDSSTNNIVNKYNYHITKESIGWSDDIFVFFKIHFKEFNNIIGYSVSANAVVVNPSYVAGVSCNSSCSDKCCGSKIPSTKLLQLQQQKNTPVISFSNKYNPSGAKKIIRNDNPVSLDTFIKNIYSTNAIKQIANKSYITYITNLPYSTSYKILENIGEEIINQTDRSISPELRVKMSTAKLRIALYNLDQSLGNFSVSHPNLYSDFVNMIRLINTIENKNLQWVNSFIGLMSVKNWSDLDEATQKKYTNVLGDTFINNFINNPLIKILLQSDASELIITASYLFVLLKMLFSVFGYSRLVPNVINVEQLSTNSSANKINNRNFGAYLSRGDFNYSCYNGSALYGTSAPPINVRKNGPTNKLQQRPMCGALDSCSCTCSCSCPSSSECTCSCTCSCSEDDITDSMTDNNEFNKQVPYNERYYRDNRVATDNYNGSTNKKSDYTPVNPRIYEFIRLFGDMYPTLAGMMGGTENFPEENLDLDVNNIPTNYYELQYIPELLWRFNDYSYCRSLKISDDDLKDRLLRSKIKYTISKLNRL